MSTPQNTTQRLIFGIMLSLVIWGIYLAIGVTGLFVDDSLMDSRKSGIVIFFVALFLGLWGVVLNGRLRSRVIPAGNQAGNAPLQRRPWNVAGLMTVALTCVGVACWIAAVFTWGAAALTATTILGWCAGLLLVGSVTAGIVALSDRSNRRGKWLGLIGLVACIGSAIAFVGRMTS